MSDSEERSAADVDETRADGPAARTAQTIGPYRLLEPIGEGGMGEVWLAEQAKPVRRKVALKIIKAGMDTAQVVARFEAERQALALMDHSAIARVFEAGATAEGRPYFAMEYIRGESITAYCERQKVTLRQRIDLFLQVCDGVQHAHQKGVIHRDLKPSNILVTLQDDRPVPKIIDFGVAKATTQPLTDRTLHTELGTFIGPWFRLDIPADAFRERNLLEVEVTNLMANRIADLDRRGVPWKKFYNVNFPARLAANRGSEGLFNAGPWSPLPSGLAGPVTLTPLRPKSF